MESKITYQKNDCCTKFSSYNSYRKLILLLVLVFSFGLAKVYATKNWSLGEYTTVNFDLEKGIVKIQVWYFDGNGSEDGAGTNCGDGNAGLNGDGETVNFGANSVLVKCDDEGHNLTVTGSGTDWYYDPAENWALGTDPDSNNRWCIINWKIPQSALNFLQSIQVSGTWWRRGSCVGAGDQTISGTIDITPTVEASNFTIGTPVFTVNSSKPAINIHWSKDLANKNADTLGNIYLREGSVTGTTKKTVSAYNLSSGDYYLYPTDDEINLNQTNTYVVCQEYTPTVNTNIKYQFVSGNITVPGFPQVTPTSFIATLDASTREVSLSWSVPSGSGNDFRTDYFKITGGKTDSVAFDRNNTTYSYSFVVPEGTVASYTYNINRFNSWYSSYFQTASVSVNLVHYKPVTATVVLSQDQRSTVVSWTTSGVVWSSGSRFVLTRQNLTTGASDAITLTQTDFNRGNYTDNLVQMCNKYQYKLQVFPNENWAYIPPINTSDITPAVIGDLTTLTVSKGYFSNKIELNWATTSGSFDKFAINRKEYGQSDSFYKQMLSVDGSPVLSTYKVEDVNAVPGVIYQYQVVGLVNCANNIVTSATKPSDIGFRTPTGDIYGRVTFSDGQAEKSVEVRLESEEEISGKSYKFSGNGTLTINNAAFLSTNTDSIGIQAWIKPDVLTTRGNILQKASMYEMYIESDRLYFKVGSQTISSTALISAVKGSDAFIHVSAIGTKDSLFLYMNGNQVGKVKKTATVTGNNNPVIVGNLFSGNIDEVRIWSKVLTSDEIKSDYKRYLVGNEKGLIGYYTFDYAVENGFYDTSFKKNTYNENHGTALNVTLDATFVPSNDQLGYKGVTGADGSYTIRAIPYSGNGIAFNIIPRLGTHKFESEKEIRFIGPNAQSHTVNFIDKSSFTVAGVVTYKGGTIPVEGVMFNIDGKTAMLGNGSIIQTNAEGEFSISVPVGTHEVQAVKNNHIFQLNGKITDSYGMDRNYQDDVFGLELTDITTIRYIGRVAGGIIQEAYLMGHSLSKNNLADGVTVTLTYENMSYKIAETDTTVTVTHFKPSNKNVANTNAVKYSQGSITIYPNAATGEFVADIIPESFALQVLIPGHVATNIPGNNATVNFENSFSNQSIVNQYLDSALVAGVWKYTNYSDTAYYNKQQKFILRYTPEISVTQLQNGVTPVSWFGDDSIAVHTMNPANNYSITLYNKNNKTYLIGKPVFEQAKAYSFRTKVFEKYIYKNSDGTVKPDITPDEVPTQDAKITFGDGITGKVNEQLAVNESGTVVFAFQVGNPELTSAIRTVTATAVYGDSQNQTSINWPGFEVVILGAVQRGNNFITNGPDKLLVVVRDPPGSNSYAYLEKGMTITNSSSYTGSVMNTGSETSSFLLGLKITTFAGVGAGVISSTDIANDMTIGIQHEENVGGTSEHHSTTTTTTRFQTSSDPIYVGANGDVFVGYSTNIAYGATDNIRIITKEYYNNAGGASTYMVYTAITPLTSDYLLVKDLGIGVEQRYGTLFAYPQTYIINTLLPTITNFRNLKLRQSTEGADFQFEANQTGKAVYVSKLTPNDANFGKSNIDFTPYPVDIYDGVSYKVYFPETMLLRTDTILALNQSIANWENLLAKNEKAKVNAELLQNYSFHAGSSVSFEEAILGGETTSQNFYISIGASVSANLGFLFNYTGWILGINESIKTQHGGNWSQTTDSVQTKGFVLEDNGYYDYISVDVCREKKSDAINQYPAFIFKTKAGATSCPYEGEYKTEYYNPGTVIDQATLKVEVPDLSVKKDFIENVPSGQPANFTLYMRNNSELLETGYYDLEIVDAANPNGAKFVIDGAPVGSGGRTFIIPAGETVVKTLEVSKGSVMNYDNLKLYLQSQCQWNITDTVSFSVHYTPSCTDVAISKPSNNWTYNNNLPTVTKADSTVEHYMDVILSGFDVNYDNFDRIMLQYKTSSGSDDSWVALMNYYNDSTLYKKAIAAGMAAEMILASNAGSIKYKWELDDMPDQLYDLRAVSVCNVNNQEIANASEIKSGIKDMYRPRLFGSAQPANGILTINDEIRLNFNETIAEGYLTDNNFEVTGVRNGTRTDHSTSVRLDGVNDDLSTSVDRNWAGKDITIEMWVLADNAKTATFFSHGNIYTSLEFGITADNHLIVRAGGTVYTSASVVPYQQGNWAHVALILNKIGYVTAYYNFVPYIINANIGLYTGNGNYVFGRSIATANSWFAGKMHNARVWDKVLTSGRLQTNSLNLLSGAESNLISYYPMNEARGTTLEDKAGGANLLMNGAVWTYPAGRSVVFNGSTQYLKLSTGSSAVIDNSMDYTMEFWFKAASTQSNATMVSNGIGDGTDMGGSANLISIGFENSVLTFNNNQLKATVDGNYLDNNWHHFALCVNRNTGRAQILMDGVLKTYFESQDLGGMAAAFMYLGVRGYTPASQPNVIVTDNFFNGYIDDFRIWDLYKNETVVLDNNNKRLDGTEKGLLAYYPFDHYIDWQGTKELRFTLEDKKVQEDSLLIIPAAIAYGGNLETAEIAPIKDKGPVEKLAYEFVVNNDALIIKMKEIPDKIEKTIVTFTADEIRDVNGNTIISPITWSAYIDRNQLKWSDSKFNLEKQAEQPLTFTTRIVNSGGAVEHFTLENMPSWMTITPSSGAINPSSSVTIKIVTDAGLNVGAYNEVIYMHNDYNVYEALPINIRVRAEVPNWSVDPGKYTYSMSVFGKLNVNGVFSNDKEDLLAAFENGKCIGITNNFYSIENDMYYTLLTIYNTAVSVQNLEFKLWDASTGIIYQAMPDRTINFVNDAIVATPASPVVFTVRNLQTLNILLKTGWNWISFNVANSYLSDFNKILSGNLWTINDIVKTEQGGFASYNGTKWVGTLIGFNNTSMYQITSPIVQTLTTAGSAVDVLTTRLTISGKGKWNYIPYLPQVNLNVTQALSGYTATAGDVLKSQYEGFSMYSAQNKWIGNLSYMKPGRGYMLYRVGNTNVTLQYPLITTPSNVVGSRIPDAAFDENVEVKAAYSYPGNMSMIAMVDGIELTGNEYLCAYIGGELRGKSMAIENPQNSSKLFFLTIAGNNEEQIEFVLERNGEKMAGKRSVIKYINNGLQGSIDVPVLIKFENNVLQSGIYPIPFGDVLNIDLKVPNDSKVDIAIYNASGIMIDKINDCNQNGLVSIRWNKASKCIAGSYLLSIAVNDEITYIKAIKK
ncbi:MAG: LamG-like jellyroll fold domain-containing protein [Paludibacter sp.]